MEGSGFGSSPLSKFDDVSDHVDPILIIHLRNSHTNQVTFLTLFRWQRLGPHDSTAEMCQPGRQVEHDSQFAPDKSVTLAAG